MWIARWSKLFRSQLGVALLQGQRSKSRGRSLHGGTKSRASFTSCGIAGRTQEAGAALEVNGLALGPESPIRTEFVPGEDDAVDAPGSLTPYPWSPNLRGGRVPPAAARLFVLEQIAAGLAVGLSFKRWSDASCSRAGPRAPAEEHFDSVLSDCDASHVLEALSIGIVILDSQLCPVYANQLGLELLAVTARQVRGRPIVTLFREASALAEILSGALVDEESRWIGRVRLRTVDGESLPGSAGPIDVGIVPVDGFSTGTHLLLELALSAGRTSGTCLPG